MATTVSDHLVQLLDEWGVRRVFGFPGDGINGILGAFQRAGNKPPFVQVRHEEMAAFMACGHAKFTGELGVCLATSGPGAVHLLNGLYDAKMDHQPVLAIVGQAALSALGASYQQEIDLLSLFKDVAEYVEMIASPAQLAGVVDRAIRIALSERVVSCLIFPKDVQEEKAVTTVPHKYEFFPGSVGYGSMTITPPDQEVRRAAELLNAGKRVAMLIGQGARGAVEELMAVQSLLGSGVAKALLGRDVLPDDLPFVTGSIGLLGTKPSYDMMMDCDTLLMVGSSMPYYQFLPKPGQARGVQIDINAKMVGIRYPMEVNLVGDAKQTLRALIPYLHRKEDRAWEQRLANEIESWWKLMNERAELPADPINPQKVFHELSPRLPERCIITCDSGSSANWFARDLKLRPGMRASISGTLATMGCSVPYAIGAKFAHPDRMVIACAGDGAMQMNGMAELLTIKKYWQTWSDPRLVVMVLHNNDLNQVTWEMRAMNGNPKFEASQDVPDINYAQFAQSIGLLGIRAEHPEEIGAGWDLALSADRPAVFDVLTDPEIPPLPPHVSWEQATAMLSSIIKGDPASGEIIRNAFRSKSKEFF